MRRTLIAANWKMNHTVAETNVFFGNFTVSLHTDIELLFCVPFTDLYQTKHILKDTGIKWGAQNVFPAPKGAYTGEISPYMLKEAGCTYVICGHSERRQILKESDEFVAKKVKAVYDNGMIPILCVGETEAERNAGKTKERLQEEIQAIFLQFEEPPMKEIVIAYEPIWAIGTGEASSPEKAEEVALYIRELISTEWGKETSQKIRILYGGSIQSNNISSFITQKNIDGCLIGGAGLKPNELHKIYQKASIKEEE